MKKISLRLPDATLEKIEMYRGDKTVSDYIRSLIENHHEIEHRESAAFQNLCNDIRIIKESLNTSLKYLTIKKDLLALSEFMAEVSSMANPPAYSHHKAEIQQLHQTLASKIQGGE